MPARVLLQDFTGVPAIVDLAAMRDAMADLGGDPARVNPLVPADLVIDHSVQVDRFGTPRRLRVQRRARVRAQRRALPAAALGPDRVPRPARRAARARASSTRSTSSSWPRSSPTATDDGRPGRLPGHARRHRLAHDDDQRRSACSARASAASRPRPCCSASRSTSRCRAIVGVRLSGELPRGSTATDLVLVVTQMLRALRRRRRVRRVRRRRPRRLVARRPGDDLEHEPGVRRDRRRSSRSTTRRSPTCA